MQTAHRSAEAFPTKDSIMSHKQKKTCKTLFALIFWIGIWALCAGIMGKELLLPTPYAVFKRLCALAVTKQFWHITCISLLRVFGGFFAGLFAGSVLAVLSCVSSIADALISPIMHIIRATPVTSFIILVMLWLRYTYVPVFICALLVLPIIYGNLKTGIKETDRQLLEVARIYRFGKFKTVKSVYAPAVSPYFISGALTSLGLAWKAGVAAEVLALPANAIGTNIYYSKIYLETPDLFAWTAVVILLSFLLEKVFVRLLKRGTAR